ncbi:DNA topoisomerase IV subunit A [Entomospira nematocerorum]|uniref:DNA topoisomerase IV subunit A n=1 Tax=Entomospira nematocerorum TaxID=2719987 RepID=A0A968GHE7_9SPIO|nr:DNA topoisomerase IV subunit A [Entomospira nematocera]NIZ47196.1 DNA topoisomerase IV subunit A [Entomospira nematocera]WDI34261.1 DNA topoisomerase IV subunit A [Entomospira nematocera]
MAQIKEIFDQNFLEYASYVIKDRAIPDIKDGLKPVQRRILYTLYRMDDGTTHKVAAVIGQTMFLHPHGDASIYEALVTLANKDLFIEKQGNFGNIFTGDSAAAARYIECALRPFAKEILFKDEITEFTPSYDGKMKEPATLPAKIPLALVLGAEGIAVGMSTRILPHNLTEVIQAVHSALRGEKFELYPDFLTGGLIDVSDYKDGLGKIISRARLDITDNKRIVVRELAFGTTCESLISSIEDATRKGKLKIGSISDYTSGAVEIEIELPRGVHADDVVPALYAFTKCEVTHHVHCLLIVDRKPRVMTVSEVIDYHAVHIQELLKQELEVEERELLNKIRVRTLERIFIEEKIYKKIEDLRTVKEMQEHVHQGFKPFSGTEYEGELTDDDVERLLQIPIRRISLFDIEKNQKELTTMQKRLRVIAGYLKNLVGYAIDYLETLLRAESAQSPRKTEITSLDRIEYKAVALRNLKLRYDEKEGYLGTDLTSGEIIADCSEYDRVFYVAADTLYRTIELPKKLFIGKKVLYITVFDKAKMAEQIFNIIYKHKENGYAYLKRFRVNQWMLGKNYGPLLPAQGQLMNFFIGENWQITPIYKETSLLREDESFHTSDYLIKGSNTQGVRLKAKVISKVKLKEKNKDK